MDKSPILTLSWGAISKICVAVIAFYIIYAIKDIIVWLIFALIIGILFNFVIDFLAKKKIPRLLSTIILYVGIFALLTFFIYKTAPIMISEMKEFTQNLPMYLSKISPVFEKFGIEAFKNTETFVNIIQSNLETASGSLLNALFSIFGGASASILVIALAFFISLEPKFIEKFLSAFSPPRYKDYVFNLWARAKRKVSGWFITRIIGVVFVGLATYIALSILNVRFAFILAIVAGLLDFIPIIGPLVAGVGLAAIVALNSPLQALFVLVIFVVIQQLENNVLFPVLFRKFVGISPVLVLVALAVGGRLWGVAGAILAIPLAGVLFEIIKDYLARMKRHTPPPQSPQIAQAEPSPETS